MKLEFEYDDPEEPKAGQFWLVKTSKGMEGVIILYIDNDFGEMEVLRINAFEIGASIKRPEWLPLKDCEFQGCVNANLDPKPNGITGGYDVDVDKEDIDAAFTILEISNAL